MGEADKDQTGGDNGRCELCTLVGMGGYLRELVFFMDEATNTQWAVIFGVFPLESDLGRCTKYLP